MKKSIASILIILTFVMTIACGGDEIIQTKKFNLSPNFNELSIDYSGGFTPNPINGNLTLNTQTMKASYRMIDDTQMCEGEFSISQDDILSLKNMVITASVSQCVDSQVADSASESLIIDSQFYTPRMNDFDFCEHELQINTDHYWLIKSKVIRAFVGYEFPTTCPTKIFEILLTVPNTNI